MSQHSARADGVFDPGLQLERTALAWRRTSLSLAIGFLVAGRILFSAVGYWGYIVAAVGLACSAWGYYVSQRNYGLRHRRLLADREAILSVGLLPHLLAALTLTLGISALVFVLL